MGCGTPLVCVETYALESTNKSNKLSHQQPHPRNSSRDTISRASERSVKTWTVASDSALRQKTVLRGRIRRRGERGISGGTWRMALRWRSAQVCRRNALFCTRAGIRGSCTLGRRSFIVGLPWLGTAGQMSTSINHRRRSIGSHRPRNSNSAII